MSDVRMRLESAASGPWKAMVALDRAVGLDPRLKELVKVRTSQLNACAFCLDMHWKDARAAGESEERLSMLPAWRESALYDERERAALELCESVTFIADGQVPDDVWDDAARVFAPDELANVLFAITVINAWNRLAAATRMQPGRYTPRRP